MRLIDADAFAEYLDKRMTYGAMEGKNRAYCKGVRDAIKDVNEQPTIDVVERKKGTWIYQLRDSENDEYRCSVCSYPSGYNYDYCPHCGSCMEKTDE